MSTSQISITNISSPTLIVTATGGNLVSSANEMNNLVPASAANHDDDSNRRHLRLVR